MVWEGIDEGASDKYTWLLDRSGAQRITKEYRNRVSHHSLYRILHAWVPSVRAIMEQTTEAAMTGHHAVSAGKEAIAKLAT